MKNLLDEMPAPIRLPLRGFLVLSAIAGVITVFVFTLQGVKYVVMLHPLICLSVIFAVVAYLLLGLVGAIVETPN